MIDTIFEAQAQLIAHPFIGAAIHFFFCACLGSYFNVFAWRWPQIQENQWLEDIYDWFDEKKWPRPQVDLEVRDDLTLSHPRSFCPSCQAPIPIWFNIPVLGWLLLRGKADCCGSKISVKYPLYEAACGLAGALAWLHFQNLWQTELFLVFAMPLFMASQTDLESMMLPDSINAFILFTGLGVAIFSIGNMDAKQAFLGACVGYATLSAIRFFGHIAFRKEAMGQGDPKLLAAICAWVGVSSIPQILLLASVSGLLYALGLKLFSKSSGPAVPFGPFLALGGLCSYFWHMVI